jgi:AcrR family transcriptional regulator
MADARQRPYKQVARAEAQQRTRDALLEAADEEFVKDGLTTSLESLAARAGVTKQTVLRHFGSKEGLIDAVLRRTSEIVRRENVQASPGDIQEAVSSLMRHYERYGDVVMLMLAEERRIPFVRRVANHGRDAHYEWVAQTFKPQLAGLRGDTRERRLAQLVAVCDVYVWKLLRRDLQLSVTETEAAVIELIEGLQERK